VDVLRLDVGELLAFSYTTQLISIVLAPALEADQGADSNALPAEKPT
jgi:hypothetical protein